MTPKNTEFDLQNIAQTLMGCVDDTFKQTCHINFSQDPNYAEREIIEYNSRLRTFGLQKFNGPSYVSAINYFASPNEMEAKKPLGAMIIYIKEEIAAKFLKTLGNQFDDDDEQLVLDNAGEFCNLIAGQLKNQMVGLGYIDLTLSAPMNAKNNLVEGVPFCFDERHLYELDFYFWKQKGLVVEITLAPVSKKK